MHTIALTFLMYLGCSGPKSSESSETTSNKVENQLQELDPLKNKGIGPVKEIRLEPLDTAMVAEGKLLFEQLCVSCHKTDADFEGPAPIGILERRTPEWIMNMIMNPKEMTEKDPIAKKLRLERNDAIMADHNVTEEEARKILEYFRTL